MHDVLILGVPLIVLIAGILLNRGDVKELRAEVRQGFKDQQHLIRDEVHGLRAEMNARFNAVDAELRYFHGAMGKLDARGCAGEALSR